MFFSIETKDGKEKENETLEGCQHNFENKEKIPLSKSQKHISKKKKITLRLKLIFVYRWGSY